MEEKLIKIYKEVDVNTLKDIIRLLIVGGIEFKDGKIIILPEILKKYNINTNIDFSNEEHIKEIKDNYFYHTIKTYEEFYYKDKYMLLLSFHQSLYSTLVKDIDTSYKKEISIFPQYVPKFTDTIYHERIIHNILNNNISFNLIENLLLILEIFFFLEQCLEVEKETGKEIIGKQYKIMYGNIMAHVMKGISGELLSLNAKFIYKLFSNIINHLIDLKESHFIELSVYNIYAKFYITNLEYLGEEIVNISKTTIKLILEELKNFSKINNLKFSKKNNDYKETLSIYEDIVNSENINKRTYNDILKQIKDISKYNKQIKEQIKGQDEIIDDITNSFFPKMFLNLNKRPISFIFAGKSGTGKTELGKTIAQVLGNKSLLIPLGNFNDTHTLQTILGAPPSYVGFGSETIIENYLSTLDLSKDVPVIIFDEIEKGHQELQNIFLELLDEGSITLLSGNKIELNKAIIIMTTNLGVNVNKKIGFNSSSEEFVKEQEILEKEQIKSEIKKFLKPEIINRLSNIYIFNKLEKEVINEIALLKIKDIYEKIIKEENIQKILQDLKLTISLEEIEEIVLKELEIDNIENIRKLEGTTENIIVNRIIKSL